MQEWEYRKCKARKSASMTGKQSRTGTFLLLLVAAVLVISSCSKQPSATQSSASTPIQGTPASANNTGGDQPAGQPSTAPQNTATELAPLPEDTAGVITFAIFSFLADAYQPVLQEFHEQHPEITVQVREMPLTTDPRQIASAADTTLLAYQQPGSGNYFLDLTPFEEQDPAFDENNYWPGILDACQDADGRIYGLPVSVEPTGIYYREQAFDAAGLPYPKPGWTWEDFQKAVNALKQTKNGNPVYGFADDSFMDTPDETLLSPLISYYLDQTGGEIDANSLNQELSWYLDLIHSGSLYSENIYPQQSPARAPENAEAWSTAWNETFRVSQDMFKNNPPAMWKGRLDQVYWSDVRMEAFPDGSLNMKGVGADSIFKSKQGIGWVPFPVSPDGQNDHTTPSVVTCAAISSGTPLPRAAWTWLTFLADHPILPEWSVAVPSVPAAVEASGYWGRLPNNYRDSVMFSAEHGWYSNPYPEAVMAVNQAVLKSVSQNTDLLTALEEAKSQVEVAVQPTPDLTPVAVVPPEPTIPPSAYPIEYFTPLFGERIEKLAEKFHNQNPDLTIKISHAAKGDVSGLASNYDCFAWIPEEGLPSNKVIDLDAFLSKEKEDIKSDYTPQELAEYSQDGKLYGLPIAYRPNMVYYNADLLAQLGIKPPAPDWTFSDLMEMINAASRNNKTDPIYGFALEYPTTDSDMFLSGRNVRLVDTSGDVPAFLFDTPETRDAVQWLADQVKAGVIFPANLSAVGSHESNYDTVSKLIADGRVAFWLSWLDLNKGGGYSLQDAGFKIGIAPIPLPGGTVSWRPYQLMLGQYISRSARNPDGCWSWVKFLSEQADNSLGIPARRSVRESDAWVSLVGPEAAAVYQASIDERRMASQENVYGLGFVRDWWNELLADVLLSGADPRPLLTELQAKADGYSACLAASSDYLAGDAQQKSQAENACATKASP